MELGYKVSLICFHNGSLFWESVATVTSNILRQRDNLRGVLGSIALDFRKHLHEVKELNPTLLDSLGTFLMAITVANLPRIKVRDVGARFEIVDCVTIYKGFTYRVAIEEVILFNVTSDKRPIAPVVKHDNLFRNYEKTEFIRHINPIFEQKYLSILKTLIVTQWHQSSVS